MGESTGACVTLRFDRRIRLEFRGATITSDAGLLACRELDDALGLTETANECLQESRGGRNVQHRLVGLLRQSVYSRLAGYEDTNDAERLAQDPTMRIIVGRRGGPERPAASTLSCFHSSKVRLHAAQGRSVWEHWWRPTAPCGERLPRRGAVLDPECGGTFVPMPHSPSRTSMSTSRSGTSFTL